MLTLLNFPELNVFQRLGILLVAFLILAAIVIRILIEVSDNKIRRTKENLKELEKSAKGDEEASEYMRAMALLKRFSFAVELSEEGDLTSAKHYMDLILREYSEDEINKFIYDSYSLDTNVKRKFTMMKKYGVPYAFRIKDTRDYESKD